MFCKIHQHAYIEICSECYDGRPFDLKSRNGDKFRYSSYWRNWSRVLSPMNALPIGQVEVDLTPVTTDSLQTSWDRVARINIRTHRTAPDANEKLFDELPAIIVQKMEQWIPSSLILDRLLHEDLLPQIDWDKYRKVCNGGAAYFL
jgi:hypothetical protein